MSNVSYYAIKTIFYSKLKEFFFEFQYTIISPLVSIFIFFGILVILSEYYIFSSENSNYLEFVSPGFVMMIVIQSSYHNISENLITMKQIGSFNDYLISPISRIEILIALIISNIFMSIILALICIIIFNFIIEFNSLNFLYIFYYLIITSLIFSSFGSIVGFLFFTWDAQQAISNFIIIPISLLSGTFFSINVVSYKWVFLFKYNPFYQIVNNFRNTFADTFEINFVIELYIFFLTLFILIISMCIFKKGYKVIQ